MTPVRIGMYSHVLLYDFLLYLYLSNLIKTQIEIIIRLYQKLYYKKKPCATITEWRITLYITRSVWRVVRHAPNEFHVVSGVAIVTTGGWGVVHARSKDATWINSLMRPTATRSGDLAVQIISKIPILSS